MASRKLIIGVILALLVGGGLLGAFVLLPHQKYQCGPQSAVQKTQLTSVSSGAVTKFMLPQNRSPNAITTAPDGSIWFGELGVPGVGHLFQNGTLVEYRWPTPQSQPVGSSGCFDWTDTWGITLWNGMVWATDQDNSSLVGLNPSNDALQTIQIKEGSNPYTVTTGPDGYLWFTELVTPGQIGKVDPTTYDVTYYTLPSGANSTSDYLLFQNGTLGYVLSVDIAGGESMLYSFNPMASSPVFSLVGGNGPSLAGGASVGGVGAGPSAPTSLAVGEGGIWLTEHSSSEMAFYDFATAQWSLYPTSSVGYVPWTLPYFDISNDSSIWVNEHYGNRIAEICCDGGGLTEYSVSDPPANNLTKIDNTLTIALSQNRLWFTEWTANYVGFIDTAYEPPFSLSVQGTATVTLHAGTSTQMLLMLTGRSSSPLSIQYSDSEQVSGAPMNLTFSSNLKSFSSLDGNQSLALTISSAKGTVPGQYTGLVTVTDGLISRSVYVKIVVAP